MKLLSHKVELLSQLKRLFIIIVFISLSSVLVYSQALSIDANKLHLVKSEQITDAQLTRMVEEGRKRGFTPAEAFNFAVAQGLPYGEASKLLRRYQNMSSDTNNKKSNSETNEPNARSSHADDLEINGVNIDSDEFFNIVDFDSLDDEIPIFGSDIFSSNKRILEPSLDIPTPVNYVIGVGDEIVVDIWGANNNYYKFPVSYEGVIFIDKVGPMYVLGLTFKELESRLISKLSGLYRGLKDGGNGPDTFASVSLGKVRSIQVTVMGEVKSPGTYSLSSLSTVLNALYKSGGINEVGSYRNIDIVRGDKVFASFDLYDVLLRGDQKNNIRLQDQDIVKVNVYSNRVLVSGLVKRPAYYEVIDSESLSSILEYAGGFASNAYSKQLKITRLTDAEKEIFRVNSSEYESFNLKDGDSIDVEPLLERFNNRVSISGAVWRPGEYSLCDGMTLSALIEKADGLRPEAFKPRGIIYRMDAKHDFYVTSFNLNEVYENPSLYDIPLQYEDSIVIRDIYEMREERDVKLFGEVQSPGTFDYKDNMTLGDLILAGNGLKSSASESKIEVYRRVHGESSPTKRAQKMAEAFVFSISRDLILEGDAKGFVLEPFDQVYIRRRPNYQEQRAVMIEGEVLYPGEYVLESRHQRISDLIERAGGVTDEAYVAGISLERKVTDIDRVSIELEDSRDERVELRRGDTNHIGLNMEQVLKNPGGADDLFLREGDKIVVPQKLQTVAVDGAVLRTTEVRYIQGKRLKYYVTSSGGYSENARKRNAYVVYANGSVKAKKNFLFFSSSPKITPGAEIIVPEKVLQARLTPAERISILTSMVSMSAVVVTAISTVKKSN